MKKFFLSLISIPITIIIAAYYYDSYIDYGPIENFFQADNINKITPAGIIIGSCSTIFFSFLFSTFLSSVFSANNAYYVIRNKSRSSILKYHLLIILLYSFINAIGFIATVQVMSKIFSLGYLNYSVKKWIQILMTITILNNILVMLFNIITLKLKNNIGTLANMFIIITMVFVLYIGKNSDHFILKLDPFYWTVDLLYNGSDMITQAIECLEYIFVILTTRFVVENHDIGLNYSEE